MASLNLGRDVANKRERKQSAARLVAKSCPLYLAVRMLRYGSLIIINPSAWDAIRRENETENVLAKIHLGMTRNSVKERKIDKKKNFPTSYCTFLS